MIVRLWFGCQLLLPVEIHAIVWCVSRFAQCVHWYMGLACESGLGSLETFAGISEVSFSAAWHANGWWRVFRASLRSHLILTTTTTPTPAVSLADSPNYISTTALYPLHFP